VGDFAAEEAVLTTPAGRRLLEEVAATRAPRPADLERWRKGAAADHVAAALRLAEGRRRGRAKFSRAEAMWFDLQGLEQATAEAVARHKARRFEAEVVVDLCAGVGGDSLALALERAGRASVLAVDRDEGMCRRCRWNAAVYGVDSRVVVVRSRAEAFAIPAGALVHVDPDRRAGGGRRARQVVDYVPGLAFLHALARSGPGPVPIPGGAIKLGPASDFAASFGDPSFEIELISLDGECKEATAWFGALAACRRRATRLPEGVTWTDRHGPASAILPVEPPAPSRWIYDPDPALLRSGLLEGFAAAHGLERCAPGVDYLGSGSRVESPFLAAFEVEEVFPLDLKSLRRVVHARGLGPLEIKTRGVNLRPEAVRARLQPPGPNPATLLLFGGGGPARAVVARRGTSRPSSPA
jgi:hypothetical protein